MCGRKDHRGESEDEFVEDGCESDGEEFNVDVMIKISP